MRDKQIKEMVSIIDTPCQEIFDEAGVSPIDKVSPAGALTCPFPYGCSECTARLLYNAGYRKASDVAREIFEEIEEALDGELDREEERERIAWMESDMREHAIHHYAGDKLETLMTAFDLLKKKYTESEGEG